MPPHRGSKGPPLYQLQVSQVHSVELDKFAVHADCANQVFVGYRIDSFSQKIENFERWIELIDDAALHVGCHCCQKFTLLFLMFQSVMCANVFECQESTVLLIEVDLCAVDDQVEVFIEVY